MCSWITVFNVAGIRSQSKPLDIMHEVFRAMKTLDYVSSKENTESNASVYSLIVIDVNCKFKQCLEIKLK